MKTLSLHKKLTLSPDFKKSKVPTELLTSTNTKLCGEADRWESVLVIFIPEPPLSDLNFQQKENMVFVFCQSKERALLQHLTTTTPTRL